MSDSTNREWRFYIVDMIGFAEKVMNYTEGMEQERFVSSGLNYDATVRNLERLGDAATIFLKRFVWPIHKYAGGLSSPPATD